MKYLLTLILIVSSPFFAKGNSIWEHYPHKGVFQPDSTFFLVSVTTITEENDNLYFSSSNSGIDVLYPNGKWSRLDYRNTPLKMFKENINDMVVKNNVIYAATRYGLLIVSDKDTILYDTINSEMTNSYITHVTIDKLNNVWFTSKSFKELTKFDGNKFTKYIIPPTVNMANYNGGFFLTTDKNNNIWYLGVRSLVKFDGLNYKYWDSTNSPILGSEGIDCFYYDELKDQFYIACSPYYKPGKDRMFRFKDENWEELDLSNMPIRQDSIRIKVMTMDKNGNLMMGFANMNDPASPVINDILILSPQNKWTLINIPVVELIGHDFLPYHTLFVDTKNILWVGTNQNGVIKADINKVLDVDIEMTGLPNIWIRSITPNPITTNSKLDFFCEPSYFSNLSIKIYSYLGIEIKDITDDLEYNTDSATGIINFNLNNVSTGLYYLNIKSKNESRSTVIIKY